MPLTTEIVRDGQSLPLRWGWWHVTVMQAQSALDDRLVTERELTDGRLRPGWGSVTTLGRTGAAEVTTQRTWVDPDDGEQLTLLPGDVLRMYRTW